jgi:hypothetical protein
MVASATTVSLPSASPAEPQTGQPDQAADRPGPDRPLRHAARSPGTNACRNLPLILALGE